VTQGGLEGRLPSLSIGESGRLSASATEAKIATCRPLLGVVNALVQLLLLVLLALQAADIARRLALSGMGNAAIWLLV
jgi:hypothetical protein